MKKFLLSFRTNIKIAGHLLLAGIVISACNKSDFKNDDTQVAGLMAFNLVPDRSAISVALSGSSLGNIPLGYTTYTGVYVNIFPGTRSVESYDNISGSLLTTTTFNFEPDMYYSAFVAGANNNYRNIVVRDNFDSLSAISGLAFVRYVNAIPDSSKPTVMITANGSTIVNEQASFASVSSFRQVSPGSVTVDVSNSTTIDKHRTIGLEPRKVYTVLLLGRPGSSNSDSLQIRFVANGELDASAGQRSPATVPNSAQSN